MAAPAPLPRHASLVVNTHSRRGRRLFREAKERLKAAGVELVHAIPVRNPRHLHAEIAAIIESGAEMVIVGGGDGSMSGAVDAFVGKDCAFALLPLGTANSFARTIGIPLDLDGAVEVIAHGRRERIDLGIINQDYFANVAAVGMPSLIGATVPNALKRAFGRLGYMIWALWCLLKFRPFEVAVGRPGQVEQLFRAVELRIANGSYLGGTETTEEAAVDSGDIVVQIITGGGRLSLAWNWLATILKLPQRKQTTELIRGERLHIETDPPLPVSIDGEVTVMAPVDVRVAKAVIEVVVPNPS